MHLSLSRRCSSQVAKRRLLRRDFASPGSAWHRCALCGERAVCTAHSIGQHVGIQHCGVGMEEYKDRVRRASG